jgi:hypothetical protein
MRGAISEHVATGFYKADARCSALFARLTQRVRLTVNDARRTVSAATVLACLACGTEFDLAKSGEGTATEIYNHLTNVHGNSMESNFCMFCDRRVPDLSAHMEDTRFRSAHSRRMRAMLTCGCSKSLREANNNETKCKDCTKSHAPHPALPEWLSKTCGSCLESKISQVNPSHRSVVLCSFCKQGKFGHRSSKSSPSCSICVNCFDLLDAFGRQVLRGNGEECRNYVCGMLNELVRR